VEHKLNKILEPKPNHTSPIERKLMIVNKCYGKFKYSQKAIDEFNLVNCRINPHAKIKTDYDGLRNNPLMIKIVKNLGPEKASGEGSKLCIEYIPKEYYDYVVIDDYDGMELIEYNLEKYKLDKIKKLAESKMEDDEKMFYIKKKLANKEDPWSLQLSLQDSSSLPPRLKHGNHEASPVLDYLLGNHDYFASEQESNIWMDIHPMEPEPNDFMLNIDCVSVPGSVVPGYIVPELVVEHVVEIVEPNSETISEPPVVEPVIEPVIEPVVEIVEPNSETISEPPVTEPVVEPVVEIVEHIPETISEPPVVEPVVEIVEHIPETISEPPVVEPVVEIVEPNSETISEPPVVEPVTEPVVEIVEPNSETISEPPVVEPNT
jgi:hypothetical protein